MIRRVALALALFAPGMAPASRHVTATRVGAAPVLDGRLDDAAWTEVEFTSDFVQAHPQEGQPATRRTEVAFVYDAEALWVGARMHSERREEIQTLLTRRDESGSAERIIVSLDTWRDRRTAYSFAVTAAGVRVDWLHPADNEWQRDHAFDPVWEARTEVTETGWTAEMRIPFSQLRFAGGEEQVWGVNINRYMGGLNEDVFWIAVPRQKTGWSSWFGELRGIRGVAPSHRVEIIPYLAADLGFVGAADLDPGDPFARRYAPGLRVGGDAKVGLGPALNLDLAAYPDFGQVEADPAEVNLTAFETFFEERRPFFTEGSELLRGRGPAYYYSRRIGAPPRGETDGDYESRPRATPILGAMKLAGRTRTDVSVAALAAVTGRAQARVFDASSGVEDRVPVEPLAGYAVTRLERQFGEAGSTVGASLTAVQRDLPADSPLLDARARTALAGGGDWNLRLDGGAYELKGHLGFSHVAGDPEAISAIQRASAHYFQRPDQGHVTLDPRRTSLTGYTWSLSAAKRTGEHWLWDLWLGSESPGLELNDLGQLGSADDNDGHVRLVYRETRPSALLQSWESGVIAYSGWNFGGIRRYTGATAFGSATLRSFWGGWLDVTANTPALSDDLTRGGPLMGTAPSYQVAGGLWSDWSAPVKGDVGLSDTWDADGGVRFQASGTLSAHLGDRVRVSVSPRWVTGVTSRQYLDTFEDGPFETYGRRYVFAFVDRRELALPVRLYVGLSPDLSLELWAEPFVARGRYSRFGELTAARARSLRTYGEGGTTLTRTTDGYQVTDRGEVIAFDDPDFEVSSVRSNLVVRWEWRPGSTLFVVWQQDSGAHTVAVKASYWFSVG